MQFGLMSLAGSWADARRDADRAAALGLHSISTGDHLRHPADSGIPTMDGWAVLAAWAATTEGLRLGMLVANMIYRHPMVLARQAVTVDLISGGRLDLGVGAGIHAVDHAMAGVPPWDPQERAARLGEFVEALDLALGGAPSFAGRFYRFDEAIMFPPAHQQPRPPIVVAALGDKALRVAAQHADGWNTFGGLGLDEEELFNRLGRQAARLDRHCLDLDRDPSSIRRSVLLFPQVFLGQSADGPARLVDRAGRLGFDELILFAPRDDNAALFEQSWAGVIADSRG